MNPKALALNTLEFMAMTNTSMLREFSGIRKEFVGGLIQDSMAHHSPV